MNSFYPVAGYNLQIRSTLGHRMEEILKVKALKTSIQTVFAILLVLSVAACASLFGPAPTELELSIEASPHLNPNTEGRPSPIVLRIYELNDISAFENSDFFTLYDAESEALGKFIVFKQELEIKPGQKLKLERKAKDEARHLAVLAAYRDLDNSRWRGSLELIPHKKSKIMIHLGSLSVSVTKPKSARDTWNYNRKEEP